MSDQVLAIIGTAGRGHDYEKLSKPKWNQVKKIVLEFVQDRLLWNLISGGAAFSDHLCVGLYNKGLCEGLELALPCTFDFKLEKFEENGFKSPGNTANYYHERFSEMMGRDSLKELVQAMQYCKFGYGDGFLDRNKIVADKAEILLAITFGDKNIVKDGGTSHTTKLFIEKNGNENAYHLDLNEMKIYSKAAVN